MNRFKKMVLALSLTAALSLCFAPNALAQDEWKFGIGTGISSFSLDGDIGFPLPGGGAVIFDVDLDNGDTSDLFESAFGLGGYFAKGKWRILYQLGTVTLEDDDEAINTAPGGGGSPIAFEVEWDRTQVEVAAVYNFAKTGNHAWGALFGARYIDHDWELRLPSVTAELDESWTDGIVGITHALPFATKWVWNNRLDAGFGDSESSTQFSTAISRLFGQHWLVNFGVTAKSIEFGEREDSTDPDFYLYDVDEPAINIGFLYNW